MEMTEQRLIEVLFQISRSLVGKQTLDEILMQIVVRAADLIQSKVCSLHLLDVERGELVIRATQSLSAAYREKPPVRIGHSVVGRAVIEKRVIAVEDVIKEPDYGYPEIARREGLKSLLVVPLMIGDEVKGVLNCYTTQTRIFSEEEVLLMQIIANHAAIAIEHVRVVEEERQTRLALETRKSVETAKRLLMKRYQMAEDAAHRLLQKMSMEKNKPLKDIADAIILAADLQD
jgi:GAF domain-containing protein